MTTTDVLRGLRPDPKDIEARAEHLRDGWRLRTEATREQLAALSSDLGDLLEDRADAARDALLDRYHELEEDLPIDEAVARIRLSAWQALRAGLSGLLVLPGLIVRGLGGLSSVADDLAERGADLSERGRELAGAIPPSRAERRRRRAVTGGAAVAGFLVGLVAGWVAATRLMAPDDTMWELDEEGFSQELLDGADRAASTTAAEASADDSAASADDSEAPPGSEGP